MIVIGDEVLNGASDRPNHDGIDQMDKVVLTTGWSSGKTRDSNSNFLAKMLFDLAIDLKRIEVIADDEDEIVEAVTRMHKNYDLVITSGGIGPTHDDIT